MIIFQQCLSTQWSKKPPDKWRESVYLNKYSANHETDSFIFSLFCSPWPPREFVQELETLADPTADQDSESVISPKQHAAYIKFLVHIKFYGHKSTAFQQKHLIWLLHSKALSKIFGCKFPLFIYLSKIKNMTKTRQWKAAVLLSYKLLHNFLNNLLFLGSKVHYTRTTVNWTVTSSCHKFT